MDVLSALACGCAALSLLSAAALLWRSGASLLPVSNLFSGGKSGKMWLNGLYVSLCFQSTAPAGIASLGLNVHGVPGAAAFAMGASAGVLLPLAYFMPFEAAAIGGLIGIVLFCAPFGTRSFTRPLSFFLLSLSASGFFFRFARAAVSAAVITQYSPQFPMAAEGVFGLVLGVCFCFLLRGEGFALLAPLYPLSAALVSVHAYLFYACGVFIGSFLRVIAHSWEWRESVPGMLNRLCVQRVAAILMCLAVLFFCDKLPIADSMLFVIAVPPALQLIASLIMLPFSLGDPECRRSSSMKPAYCVSLFRPLPQVLFAGLKAECVRLFTIDRGVFLNAVESLLNPESVRPAAFRNQTEQAAAYEARFLRALKNAAEETPCYIDPSCLAALAEAGAGLKAMRTAAERFVNPPVTPGAASMEYLAALQAATLRDIDHAMALFTEKSGFPTAEPRGPGLPPEEEPFAAMAGEICRSVSLGALLAGSSLEKLSGFPNPRG